MKSTVKTWIFLIVLCAVFLHPSVESKGEQDSKGKKANKRNLSPQLQRILKKLDKENENVDNLSAKVNYVRAIPLLDEQEKAKGRLQFCKPDLVHLKLGNPRNEEVFSNGETWWIVGHDDKQVEIYESANRGQSIAEASFLTFGYGKSSDALLKDYKINIVKTQSLKIKGNKHKSWLLSFTPRDKKAPARFSRIEVKITDRLWLPEALILHESDGEIVHRFHLQDINLNSGLEKSAFQYEPKDGYTIVRPE